MVDDHDDDDDETTVSFAIFVVATGDYITITIVPVVIFVCVVIFVRFRRYPGTGKRVKIMTTSMTTTLLSL